MPIIRIENKTQKLKFTFNKGIDLHVAVAICKMAQKEVSPITARFDVQPSRENPENMVAELTEIGAFNMKRKLEDITGSLKMRKVHLLSYCLEFLAQDVIKDKNYSVSYIVSFDTDKYKSKLYAIGDDVEDFFSTIEAYKEKYLFSIPPVLTFIVLDRTTVKLHNRELAIRPCGNNTIVRPYGPKAEAFYDEFYSLCNKLVMETKEYEGYSDKEILEVCENIKKTSGIRDVYYYIKSGVILLKGFDDTLPIFSATIPLKLEGLKKKQEVKSEVPKKQEVHSNEVSDVEEIDEDQLLEEEVAPQTLIQFGEP